MIDLYFWTSPNVQKITLFLEEAGLYFRLIPTDVTAGAQYAEDFVKIAPNSRLPVIVDNDPGDAGEPFVVFESGAILLYLAEKTAKFLATEPRLRMRTLQWLFWQVGGLGPFGGQRIHFRNYAPFPVDYAIKRYDHEFKRLLAVLDHQLDDAEFLCGDYSIADMASYPWIAAHDRRGQLDFGPIPNLRRWYQAIAARPATKRAYDWITEVAKGNYVKNRSEMSEESRRILFGAHAVETIS